MNECFICGRYGPTERHHVFNGPFRKKSTKYGFVVDLCHWCHNEPPNGVHFNQEVDNELKAYFQRIAMKNYEWTKEDFIREFGRSYI